MAAQRDQVKMILLELLKYIINFVNDMTFDLSSDPFNLQLYICPEDGSLAQIKSRHNVLRSCSLIFFNFFCFYFCASVLRFL